VEKEAYGNWQPVATLPASVIRGERMSETVQAPARRLPRHVAIIMDGNGRWAEARGLPRIEGHREGAKSVRDIVRASRQMGLEAITLYAFSAQNWARPADEVRGLMQLLHDYMMEERSEILENGIRLNTIGNIGKLPDLVLAPLRELIKESRDNTDMVLTLALSYDARESIALAAQVAARDLAAQGESLDALTAASLGAHLPTSDLPPLDLLVRTSGELRVSNFLLWEVAYAELFFSDALWPDFRRNDLYQAVEAYSKRERRFGLTGSQIESGGDLAP